MSVQGSIALDRSDGASAAAPELRWSAAKELVALCTLLTLAGALFFFHLGSYGLWEPDEARYAEIPREMLATGSFIVPHLNYVPYIEKPPLLYWLTAASLRVFGISEFAARLINALSALLGVVATYVFGRRMFDRRRAILGAAMLATSPLYTVMAQVLTTDMLLTALVTIAFFSFFLAWQKGGSWRWLFYGAMGFAVLTKGPIGAVLPVLAAVIFMWWQGGLIDGLRKLHPLSGFLLTGAIALPWFAAISIKLPGFIDFYFIGEHFRRFLEPGYSHTEAIYFYIPVLLAGSFPWSAIALAGNWSGSRNPARSFCLITGALVLIFFSLASAKLIPYILPAMPPLALLIADLALTKPVQTKAASRAGTPPSQRLWLIGLLMALAGVIAVAAAWLVRDRFGYVALVQSALVCGGAVATLGGLATAVIFRTRGIEQGLTAMVLTMIAVLLIGSYGRLAAEPLRSYARLSRAAASEAPDATVICYRRYVQAAPFYYRKRVVLVGAPSELGFGAAHSLGSGDYFFLSDADLLRLWRRPGKTVLLIDQPDLDRLSRSLGGFRIIAAEHFKRAVVKVSVPNAQ